MPFHPARSPSASRRHLVAVVLLALLTSSVSFDGETAPTAQSPTPRPSTQLEPADKPARGVAATARAGRTGAHAPPPAPIQLQPVTVQQARVRVDDVQPGALEAALAVPGVSFATVIATADAAIAEPGGARVPLRVAMVDPAGFRVLTPQVTADAHELWARLAEGDAVFTHEFAQQLLLQLGTQVPLGDGQPLRVGGFGTTVAPPVADVIVNPTTGERLGMSGAPRSLLVAVAPGVRPETVARTLQRELAAPAHVIADPRAPRQVILDGRITADNVWDWLAQCESGGDWHINTGNGYYGGLQFLPESWFLVGGTGMPHEASPEEQIHRAKLLLAIQGWEAWPVCSIILGLRPGPLPERYRRDVSGGDQASAPEAPPPSDAGPTETTSPPQDPATEAPPAEDAETPAAEVPPLPSNTRAR